MTDEDKKAERVKALASAVYREMDHARRSEDYVRTIAAKHGDHAAFQAYMREMCLTETLDEFLSRPTLKGRSMNWIPACDGKNYLKIYDDGSYEIIDEKGGP